MSTTQTLTIAPAGTWELDAVHSAVGFEVEYLGGTFKGGFREIAATLVVGDGSVNLEGSAKVASVDVKDENLAGHLQSPDFFDAERYPQVKFSSTELTVEDDGSVRLAGDFELHGETRRVEATGRFGEVGEDIGGNPRLGLSLATAIDRRDWGVDWNAELPKGGNVLEYEVAINVELELVAQES